MEEALAADPRCYAAWVLRGEIHEYSFQELGLDELEATNKALEFYNRAIELESGAAEAYAERSRALYVLRRYEEAIVSANCALARLKIDPTLFKHDELQVNLGESAYRAKALALIALERKSEARAVLREGLTRFVDSEYLGSLLSNFLPKLVPPLG